MSSIDFALDAAARSASSAISSQSGIPLVRGITAPVTVYDTHAQRRRLRAKRLFDIVVSSLALIALGPMLLLVAIAVRGSGPGPVLFRQVRQGIYGRPFSVFKFRTMRIEDCDDSGVAQTTQDDPRVTGIGRFLRRTSIDELPQLFNVLRGEMSLVGPRPHVAGMRAGGTEYTALVNYYDQRLSMLPGLTGWAQANGLRGSTSDANRARARVDHDVAYIQNFTIWIDIVTLAKTVRREFLGGSGD